MNKETVEKQREAAERMISGLDEAYIAEAIAYRGSRGTVSLGGYAKKAAVAVFAVLVFGSLGVTAAAACGYLPAMEILGGLYPDLAKRIVPVQERCTDSGIEMQVEGVYLEDDVAQVYVSMKDLTGDRIDETIDLFDSYAIETGEDQIGGCQFVEYDAADKTAYFLIELQNAKGSPFKGSYMTFHVTRFLSHKLTTKSTLQEINLKELPREPEVQNPEEEGLRLRGGSAGSDGSDEEGRHTILRYHDGQAFSPTEGVEVTAWGMIGDALHIQVYYEDILTFDNHGWIMLKDADAGDSYVDPQTYAYFDSEGRGSYEEYVFDLGPEADWGAYSLEAEFSTCTSLTEGDWRITFPVEQTAAVCE